jgi:hypothetical protein
VTEYFVKQFDGGSTTCDGKNCACASGATAVAFGSGGEHQPTSDQFRARSGVSCIPGRHSASGGLFISDVERTAAIYGVTIDYGREPGGGLKRWTATEQKARLKGGLFGMVCLGDYDQLPAWLDEQPGFHGDHSTFVHNYRASDDTVCWHDPLGKATRRVKWSVVVAYNQKPGSPVKGLAGFVRIVIPLPPTDTEEPDMPGLDLRPIGQLQAGTADVDKGVEVIYSMDRRRAKTTAAASGRQATGLYDPAQIGGVQEGYEVLFAEGMAWVRVGPGIRFTPAAPDDKAAFNAGVTAATAAAATARRK